MTDHSAHRRQVEAAFPELRDIGADGLRESVVDVWATALAETDTDDLSAVPWFPPVQDELDLPEALLVDHVRDVVHGAVALAEPYRERGVEVDLDLLVAAALVHDVSKLYEFDGTTETRVGNLLGHPYYGVYAVAVAGLPVELAHVVLSHTDRTNVEPATPEAVLVKRADEAAAAAIRFGAVDDLRDA